MCEHTAAAAEHRVDRAVDDPLDHLLPIQRPVVEPVAHVVRMQRTVRSGDLVIGDVDVIDSVESVRQVKRAVDVEDLRLDTAVQPDRQAPAKFGDGGDELRHPVGADANVVDERQLIQAEGDRAHDVLADRRTSIRKRGMDVHVLAGERAHHAAHSIVATAVSRNSAPGTTTSCNMRTIATSSNAPVIWPFGSPSAARTM